MPDGPWELPKGWHWASIEEVCEYRSGIWGPDGEGPDGVPVVRSTEIDGMRVRTSGASVRLIPPKKREPYVLETGDILINKSSGSRRLVGWPVLFEHPRDGRPYLFSNFMLRLRLSDDALPWFMLFYLQSPAARRIYLEAQNTTSGLRNLRIRDFVRLPVPLPSAPEQRRIVAKLEAIFARTREAKRLQASAREDASRLLFAASSALLPSVGDDLPERWRWALLNEMCELHDAARVPVKKRERTSGDTPYCGANGVIDHVNGFTHEGEFVLLAEDGGFYGPGEDSAYIMSGRFWANNHAHVLRGAQGRLTNSFLCYWLRRADLRPFLTGATRPKLTQSSMRRLPVPVPPLPEQDTLSSRLRAIEQQITHLQAAQDSAERATQQMDQCVLDRAFRGEL